MIVVVPSPPAPIELAPREAAVLAALAGGALPWADARTLARRARCRARPALTRLAAKGLVCAWESDAGGRKLKRPRYIFTPLGSYLFDVRLDELDDYAPRWFPGYRGRCTLPLRCRYEPGQRQLRYPGYRPGSCKNML